MIKKIIGIILFFIILLFPITNRLDAAEIAGQSATLKKENIKTNERLKSEDLFIKRVAIDLFLKKWHSPMAANSDDFIKTCVKYNLDCYLLPAIAGVESTFGKHILARSYNPFGWNGGNQRFNNFKEAIQVVGKNLRGKYLNRGAKNIMMIGYKYSVSPAWPYKVKYFTKKFFREEEKIRLYSQNLSVEF